MHKIKVSFILISYNQEKYIRQAIESILSQTYSPDEIVIVDDCSQDNSLAIIQEYAHKDSRIQVVAHKHNLGPSLAINSGIRKARGEYIIIQSGDDISLPLRVEEQVRYLEEHPHVVSVCTHVEAINDAGIFNDYLQPVLDTFNRKPCSQYEMLRIFFLDNNFLNASSQAFRSSIFSIVGYYNPTLLQCQDYDMHIRMSFHAPIHILEKPLLQYRIRDDGSNISVGKGVRAIRSIVESDTLLNNYFSITTPELFYRIFGEIYPVREETIPYFLGKILLDDSNTVFAKKLWGLRTIYESLDKEGVLDILHTDTGLTYKDVITYAESIG